MNHGSQKVERHFMKNKILKEVFLGLMVALFLHVSAPALFADSAADQPKSVILDPSDSVSSDAENDPYADDEFDDEYGDEDLDYLEEEYDDESSTTITVADPLFYWNYTWFYLNDKFYIHLLKPVVRGYKWITPEFFRQGVKNFSYNLAYPIRFVGCLLQGKLKRAGQETARFIVNTIAGVGGLFDPAGTEPSLNPPAEDIRQVLGKWGLGNGFYIVWPLLGPSTFRDSFGIGGNILLHPWTWILSDQDFIVWFSVRSAEFINEWTFYLGEYTALKEAALDPYQALRDAYISNMRKRIDE
jgi:phospholipid-binding lipoprotein MlaA